jgi:arsenite methyltransferase
LRAALRYGIEAPYVPALLTLAAVAFFVAWGVLGELTFGIFGLIFLAQAVIFLHTTIRGKLRVWDRLLDDLHLQGNESVLDLGCGRGAVLIAAARRLRHGSAVGIDIWRSQDQSGNRPEVAAANAAAAGVSERLRLDTGDMTDLPYESDTFDVVTSALAVHNIPTAAGRAAAIREAVRVLRPGGRLVIVDFRHINDYLHALPDQQGAAVRRLGPAYWYGGPWTAASALLLTKS